MYSYASRTGAVLAGRSSSACALLQALPLPVDCLAAPGSRGALAVVCRPNALAGQLANTVYAGRAAAPAPSGLAWRAASNMAGIPSPALLASGPALCGCPLGSSVAHRSRRPIQKIYTSGRCSAAACAARRPAEALPGPVSRTARRLALPLGNLCACEGSVTPAPAAPRISRESLLPRPASVAHTGLLAPHDLEYRASCRVDVRASSFSGGGRRVAGVFATRPEPAKARRWRDAADP